MDSLKSCNRKKCTMHVGTDDHVQDILRFMTISSEQSTGSLHTTSSQVLSTACRVPIVPPYSAHTSGIAVVGTE